jgi:ABC-2 type transport system ATP-binding protein
LRYCVIINYLHKEESVIVPIVEASNLSKRFKNILAVDDLTLAVEKGEVLGFLGPNGAGKTTTIRMLTGMIAPSGGQATVAGLRTDKNVEKLHEAIGLLTESPGFYDNLNALVNLEYYASFYPGIDSHLQAEKYLRMLGLWERRETRVGTYSKGMKQRLALARALIHEPQVLFLDEPTAGLDPEAAGEVRNLISDFSREGRTIFLSTHNLNEAEQLCQRIAVMHTHLLALDTAEQLRHRFFRRQVIVQLESIDAKVSETIRKLPFVEELQEEGKRFILELADPERNRPELVKAIVDGGGRIMSVTEKQHPLEDVYMKLIREEADRGT